MYKSTLSLTSALDVGGWSTPRPGRFTPGKESTPFVKEAGWAPGPVWTSAENLAPTGIRSPDRPFRRKSLYGLSYPGSLSLYSNIRNWQTFLNISGLFTIREWTKRMPKWTHNQPSNTTVNILHYVIYIVSAIKLHVSAYIEAVIRLRTQNKRQAVILTL
jgi:hypothetical protein